MAQTFNVASQAELKMALSNASGGDIISLAGGNYGNIQLFDTAQTDLTFASTVTIKSADAANPALFSGMDMRNATNIAIEGVVFDYTFAPGDKIYRQQFVFNGCEGLTLRGNSFDGDVAQGVSAVDDGFGFGYGLIVRNSKDVVITGNELQGFWTAVSVSASSNVSFTGNEIYDIRSDGIDVAAVTGILIEGNYIHDFRASLTSGDHRDMIQFWTTGTTTPSTDIVIRNNYLDVGQGNFTQSIFMRNERVDTGQFGSEMFYQNILIENNVIINAHLHGITVGETNGLIIRNNSVLHADGGIVDGPDGGVEIPQISVAVTSTGVLITNNLTSNIAGYTNQTGWTVMGNAIVQDQNPNAPGFYGDVFLASSLEPVNGVHGYIILPGSALDLANIGANVTQPEAGADLAAARFHVTRPEGNSATRVFDARFTEDLPAGTRLEWNFGDGTTSFGTIVEHAFAEGGQYGVTLTVRLPDGSAYAAALTIGIAGADVLELGPTGAFVAYENGAPTVLALPAAGSANGLQLGAAGAVAIVSRAHVVDLVAADEYKIDLSLKADAAGSAGEVFRLHGSFVAAVTSTGELAFTLMPTAGQQIVLTTSGAGLGDLAEHDISIRVTDGQIEILVDGTTLATRTFTGDMGFTGYHDLTFGNPWGSPNFNGDLTAFHITADASDYPATPQSTVLLSSTLTGGTEDNTFIFNASHLVIQDAGGMDEVQSSVLSLDLRSWQLDGIENARLTSAQTLDLTGDAGANVLAGNAASNRLDGMGGADTLKGGDGDDTYVIADLTDSVVENGTGTDIVLTSVTYTLDTSIENATLTGAAAALTGNSLANILIGNAADNRLDGMGGADTLRGGNGDDTYVIDDAGDRVVETGTGIDTVLSAISYGLDITIENATLIGTARAVTGNSLANILVGNAANNRLDGMGGADRMSGAAGNDTYVVNHRGDRVVETGTGVDRVLAAISYTLTAGVENAFLTGTAQALTGNRLDNILIGNAANNHLDGMGGADRMRGGDGNDTYVVNHRGDRVVDNGGGIDRVFSSFTYTLNAGIENATLTGTARGLTGNRLDNRLVGNDFANRLDGMGGSDRMRGDAGADVFVFRTGHDRDTITDFDARGADHDLLDLRDLRAITSFRDLIDNHTRQSGDHVVINAGNGDVIRLLHVDLADLQAVDVLI